MQHILNIAEYLSRNFRGIDPILMLKLLYVLRAWIKISKTNNLKDELSFYNKNIDIPHAMKHYWKISNESSNVLIDIKRIFSELGKEYRLFALYDIDENIVSKELLLKCLEIADSSMELPKVDKIFHDYIYNKNILRLEDEIAELSIKLLDIPHHETLHVPRTEGFGYAYYTDNPIVVTQNKRLNEQDFFVELINLLENKNINVVLNEELDYNQNSLYPYVLSFPPQGQKKLKNLEQANIVLDGYYFYDIAFNTEKKAVIMMSVKFAYRQSYQEIRKQIIKSNIIEAIIQLPEKLHGVANSEMLLYVINKEEISTKVQLINLTGNQFEKKHGRRKHLANINEVIEIYKSKKEIEGISILVSNETFAQNNYSFVLSQYFSKKEINITDSDTIFLEDFATIKKSQSFFSIEKGDLIYEISPSNFTKNGFTIECGKEIYLESSENIRNYLLEPFDILISSKGSIGKIAIIGEITQTVIGSQAVHIIRVKKDKKKNAIALYMYLKSKNGQLALQYLTNGRVMPIISTIQLNKFKIPNFTDEQLFDLVHHFNQIIELQNEIDQIEHRIEQIYSTEL